MASVGQIAADCEVKPNAAAQVFTINDDDASMKMVVNPVAFRLKESARADRAEMFVTVKGRLNFSIDCDPDLPLACYFATTVAYFHIRGGKLDHTLGVHYDYDDQRPAHPVFHAQIKSFSADLAIINDNYSAQFVIGKDLMTGVAEKVRLPTAHMDPLAVFVQLLADHLVNANSGSIEKSAFEKARTALMFFRSDPRRSERLAEVSERQCFRGPRWYPQADMQPI